MSVVPAIGCRVQIIATTDLIDQGKVGRIGYVYDVGLDGDYKIADGDPDGPENGWSWITWAPADALAVLSPDRQTETA